MFLRRCLPILTLVALCLVPACSDTTIYPSQSLTEQPDAITDATLAYEPGGDAAVLSWTAPHTHGGTTQLLRYDIRYDYGGPLEWETAREVIDAPTPVGAGRRQSYRFVTVDRGRALHATVRAIDVSGNVSAPGNVATLHVPGYRVEGRLMDALTGAGAAGVAVSYGGSSVTTETDGTFSFDGLLATADTFDVAGTTTTPAYFPVSAAFVVSSDTVVSYTMIPYRESQIASYLSTLTLFKTAAGVRSNKTILRKWPSLPVDLYIPDFVNVNGIDYAAAAREAAERWMDLTGLPLFRFVDALPERGVDMRFRPVEEMGIQIGYTEHTSDPDGTPLLSRISVVDKFNSTAPLDRTMLHELGHTIRLSHLPSGFLMYGGLPLPDDPTAEEVWFVRVLEGLRDRTDLSIYRELDE